MVGVIPGSFHLILQDIIKMAMITYCFHKIFIKLHLREKTEALVESAIKKLSEKDSVIQ